MVVMKIAPHNHAHAVDVSIIVPIYNAQKTLARCVQSIIAQTFSNISIILVDDGATDVSGKMCDHYASLDERIHVIHKPNGGVISARFAGVALLPESGYCTFCDADDYLSRDAIQKIYDCIVESESDIVCANNRRFFAHIIQAPKSFPPILTERKTYDKEQIEGSIIPSFFGITNYPGYMHGKLYRNSILKQTISLPYPPIKFFQEDIAFNLRATLLAQRVTTLPDVVYNYRIGGGTSSFMPSFFSDCIALYNFKHEIIQNEGLDDHLRYTTDVELKNELATWLEMYFEYVKGEKASMLAEIECCCNVYEIRQALSYSQTDHSGIIGFKELAANCEYNEIYSLIAEEVHRKALKKAIKRLIV